MPVIAGRSCFGWPRTWRAKATLLCRDHWNGNRSVRPAGALRRRAMAGSFFIAPATRVYRSRTVETVSVARGGAVEGRGLRRPIMAIPGPRCQARAVPVTLFQAPPRDTRLGVGVSPCSRLSDGERTSWGPLALGRLVPLHDLVDLCQASA